MEALETMAVSIAEAVGKCGKQQEALHFLNQHGIFLNITPQVFQMEMNQDETKFRQIAGNLIKNALHHRKKRLEIKMQQEKDRLVMDVIDDGPGIDSEFHQLIFKRYAQVNECTPLQRRGHGLGLAGARIMARCLGGDIELNSKKGKGAVFRLILPVSLDQNTEYRDRIA
jgi:signal transduction histidine kinase